ncbi:DUF6960 family protein [Leminorella grimontii]|uniref:DUF6960 family protein n=1 Tax=Leminorella grimontii TaxID=82981 RepID=UPI002080BFA6|nr:hypothetical protein [Leminorella grimontii]GKX58673.1 hypothetical protein SOASR031_09880 [Leminorella grimontii]
MMTTLDFQERWGLYPWFDGDDVNFIHPDDIELARKLLLYGKVFYCIKQCREFIVLTYGDFSLRVNSCLFKTVRDILFFVGSNVSVVSSLNDKVGTVIDIGWHHKNNEPIYYLSFNGKKSSRRYFEDELISI